MKTLRELSIENEIIGQGTSEDVRLYIEQMTLLTASNEDVVRELDPNFYEAAKGVANEYGRTPEMTLNFLNIVKSTFVKNKEESGKNIGTGKKRLLEQCFELYSIYVQICEKKDHHPIIQDAVNHLKPIFEEYRNYFQQELNNLENPRLAVTLEHLSFWWKKREHEFNGYSKGTFDGLFAWANSVKEFLKNRQGNDIQRESLRVKFNEGQPTKNTEEPPCFKGLDTLYERSN